MRTPKSPEPFTERQVTPGIQEGKFETHVPEGAFGGVSPKVEEAENKTVDLATKIQDSADQFQIQKAKNYIAIQSGQYMADATTAKGENSVEYNPAITGGKYEPFWKDTSDNALKFALNGRQRKFIQEDLGNTDASLHRVVGKHVVTQLYQQNIQNQDAGIATTIAKAQFTSSDLQSTLSLRDQLDQQTIQRTKISKGAKPDDNLTQAAIETQRSNFDKVFLNERLAKGDIQSCNDFIDSIKSSGKIAKPNLQRLEGMIQKKSTQINANDTYQNLSLTNRDEAGYPDTQAILTKLRNNPDIQPGLLKTYTDTATALAGKERSEINTRATSRMMKFQDVIDKNREKLSVQQQVDIADRSAVLPHEGERMEKYVLDYYKDKSGLTLNFGGAAKTKAQDEAAFTLHENIANGYEHDPVVIDRAVDSGILTPMQAMKEKDFMDKTIKGGPNKEMGVVRNQIRREAFDVLPTEDAQKFMTNLDNDHSDSPDDMTKFAKQTLDPETKNPSAFYRKISGQRADFDNATIEGDADLIKSLKFEVGPEPLSAIMKSISTKEYPKPTMENFQKFLEGLGNVSIQDIGRGKPLNKLMKSLLQYNQNHPGRGFGFTPDNLSKLIEAYPDGYIPNPQ